MKPSTYSYIKIIFIFSVWVVDVLDATVGACSVTAGMRSCPSRCLRCGQHWSSGHQRSTRHNDLHSNKTRNWGLIERQTSQFLYNQAKYKIYAVELKTEVNERPSVKRDCDHESNYTVLLNYYATKWDMGTKRRSRVVQESVYVYVCPLDQIVWKRPKSKYR